MMERNDQTNDDKRRGENGVLINGFNGFSDADAIVLLIGPILFARPWSGKSNCLTNQKKDGGSQLKRGDANKHQNKRVNGSRLN